MTANWLSGGASAVDADGEAVHFDDTATSKTVNISTAVSPADIVINSTTAFGFVAAGISGGTGLTKLGSGTLNISGSTSANGYSGGTLISSGTIALGDAGSNAHGLVRGAVTLNGGTLQLFSLGSSSTSAGNFTNAINVDAGTTGTPIGFGRGGLSSSLFGAGTLNYQTDYVRADMIGNWSAFTGQINVTKGPNGGDFRIQSTNGFGHSVRHFHQQWRARSHQRPVDAAR